MPEFKKFPPAGNSCVTDAAFVVLSQRLVELKKSLRKALAHAHEDPECVHKLRVATRRLTAGLRLFEPALDPKRCKPMMRAARRLRKTAGEARDLDVLESMIAARTEGPHAIARDQTSALANVRRRKKRAYRKLYRDLPDEKDELIRAASALRRSMKQSANPPDATGGSGRHTLAELARRELPARLTDAFRISVTEPSDLDSLHQLRIAIKRLRYAMEVFFDCLPVGDAKALYERVERLQQHLGDINDLRNLRAFIDRAASRAPQLDGPAGHDHSMPTLAEAVGGELRDLTSAFLETWPPTAGALVRDFAALFQENAEPAYPLFPRLGTHRTPASQRTGRERVDR